jgi:hypothetical protein
MIVIALEDAPRTTPDGGIEDKVSLFEMIPDLGHRT